MTEPLSGKKVQLFRGDAAGVLKRFPDAYFDAMVTDPPAGISFMGKTWDRDHGGRDGWVEAFAATFRECFRVLKPGAHALVWAIPRTSHWTATALEDAGFEVRDVVVHLFGTGFPKSLDVSKAIDKAAGAERKVVGRRTTPWKVKNEGAACIAIGEDGEYRSVDVTASATEEAKQWNGWGTALKPASEHWILVRKPLEGTVAINVLEHGTGALNIDKCRTETEPRSTGTVNPHAKSGVHSAYGKDNRTDRQQRYDANKPSGRWPANVVHDGSDEVLEKFPTSKDGVAVGQNASAGNVFGGGKGLISQEKGTERRGFGSQGSAARFFYCAKASKREREEGLPEGEKNQHPTVKSVALMRWLCRLVTPSDGLLLDPFVGSGSTLVAAVRERFRAVGIEREAEYVKLAAARVGHALKDMEDKPVVERSLEDEDESGN